MAAYADDKGRIYEHVQRACVYNVADPVTEELVREADVVEGARAIGFTLGTPGVGMLGVVDDVLVDRAFVEQRASSAAELGTLADLGGRRRPATGPAHRARTPCAAAALAARPRGQPGGGPRRAARPSAPATTGSPWSPSTRGVTWVDDSKATNPHAARAVAARLRVGGVGRGRAGQGRNLRRPGAGGSGRLRGAVLIGRDRGLVAAALRATRAGCAGDHRRWGAMRLL